MAEFGADDLEEMADDLEEFRSELKSIRTSLDHQIERAVATTAERLGAEMERQIIEYDAVDSGELLNSITVDAGSGDYTWEVGPTADHAPYVEYGTGQHDITPDGVTLSQVEDMSYSQLEASNVRPLTFVVDGELVKTYHVDHPGTPKQPFFRDAVDRADAGDWLEDNLEREIDERFAEVLR